jgi:ureidoacrylate peracid hydrolase
MPADRAPRATRSLNRRELISLTGATAALLAAAGERAAVAQAGVASPKAPGRIVRIDAKPEPISIDIARTVVIVVDMTNDFGSKGGMFDRAGIDIAPIQRVVRPTARVLAAARRAGIQVLYLSMAYQPDLSDVGPVGSPNWRVHKQFLQVGSKVEAPDGTQTRILIRDTWGTRVLSDLRPQPGEPVIYKTRYSGFYETELDEKLQALSARYLVMTGCTTSVCVESTLRDAMFRDYSPVLLADCSAEPMGYKLPRSNHEASLLVIETLLGWVCGSERFITALEAPASPA